MKRMHIRVSVALYIVIPVILAQLMRRAFLAKGATALGRVVAWCEAEGLAGALLKKWFVHHT